MSILKSNFKLKCLIIFVLFFLLSFLFINYSKAYTVVKPSKDFYINDFANVLDDSLEKTIIDKSVKLYNSNHVQIVVLTINTLDGIEIEDYANTFYNENEIGSKEKDGLLILLSIKERKIRVEVGEHLEGDLPDGKVGRILDQYAIPYFKNNNWNEGINSLYNALYEFVSTGELELEKNEISEQEYNVYVYGAIASATIAVLSYFLKKYTIIPFMIMLVVEYYFLGIKGSFTFIEFLGIAVLYVFIFLFVIMFINSKRSRYIYERGGTLRNGGGHSGGGGHSSGGGASRKF